MPYSERLERKSTCRNRKSVGIQKTLKHGKSARLRKNLEEQKKHSRRKQILRSLEYFAEQEAEKAGGFPDYPPETTRVRWGDEEYSWTNYRQGEKLQQSIQGVISISRWARQAEEETKLASRRAGKGSKEAARAMEELVHFNIGKGPEFDICNEIFDIWVATLAGEFFARPLAVAIARFSGPLS